MKVYNTIGPWHYLIVLLLPVGSWIAASKRAYPAAFFAYGAAPTALFGLMFALQYRWFAGPEPKFIIDVTALCVFPIMMGYFCRTAAIVRWQRDREWARLAHRCIECSYDLTGNVSGICPECGAMISTPRRPPPPAT